MAYIVRRPAGRWEIRESRSTSRGPRARTLVSFRVLTAQVLQRAEESARGPFDRERLLRAGRRAGVSFELRPADGLASALLAALTRDPRMRPGLRRLLHDRLEASPLPEVGDDSVAEWIGASASERGRALVDLLGLADRLPKRPGPLSFPGLSPERLRR